MLWTAPWARTLEQCAHCLYSSQNLQEQKHKVENALQQKKLDTFNWNFPMFFSLK